MRRLAFTGEAVHIADDEATYSQGELAALAVSGRTLVYRKAAESDAARSLAWIDRNGKVGEPVGGRLESTNGNSYVRLSPDGKRVAFSSMSDGSADDIWTYDFERNIRTRVTTDPGVDHVPIWPPDGTRIVFDSHAAEKDPRCMRCLPTVPSPNKCCSR